MAKRITWKQEEVKLLVNKVFKAVKRGLPIEVGFDWTAAKLPHIPMSSIRSLWNFKLNDKYKDRLDEYRKGVYQQRTNGGAWSKSEDFKVVMAVKKSIVTKKPLDSLFQKLSIELDRTYSSVMTRWYKTLSKNERIQKDLEEFKKVVTEEAV